MKRPSTYQGRGGILPYLDEQFGEISNQLIQTELEREAGSTAEGGIEGHNMLCKYLLNP